MKFFCVCYTFYTNHILAFFKPLRYQGYKISDSYLTFFIFYEHISFLFIFEKGCVTFNIEFVKMETMWFGFGRDERFPTQYSAKHYPVTVDVLEAGLIFCFVLLAVCFYIVLPGKRGMKVKTI